MDDAAQRSAASADSNTTFEAALAAVGIDLDGIDLDGIDRIRRLELGLAETLRHLAGVLERLDAFEARIDNLGRGAR